MPSATLRALFGGLSNAGPGAEEPASYTGGVRSSPRKFEQAHLVLGFEAPSYREDEFFAAQVLSGLLGGGMSSRLFQEVRERRGLCYAIYSTAWGLKDTGLFAVHAATGAGMVGELIDVVSDEIDRMADAVPSDAEVARAKAQLKAGLMMSLESSSARAEQMARQMFAAWPRAADVGHSGGCGSCHGSGSYECGAALTAQGGFRSRRRRGPKER